jgi:hypothetical protein
MDGINAVRETIPKCWFDADRTDYGLDALRQYRSEYKEDEAVFQDRPLHDWTSHAADAFRYLAMAWKEMKAARPDDKPQNHVLTALPGGLIQSNMTVRDIIEARKRKREAD